MDEPTKPAAGSETAEDRERSERAYRAELSAMAKETVFLAPPDKMREEPGDYTDE